MSEDPFVPPAEALRRLMEGNQRFVEDPRAEGWTFRGPKLKELASGQRPFAAVLGCADSRVPVEVVFGQGPGQLFVVRVAGNVVAPTQLGSLEFAILDLGVRFVMVLGHSACGAVGATLAGHAGPMPAYLRSLTRRIVTGIQPALEDKALSPEHRLDVAIRLNVLNSSQLLLKRSKHIRRLHASGELGIASAFYDVGTGAVEVLEGVST